MSPKVNKRRRANQSVKIAGDYRSRECSAGALATVEQRQTTQAAKGVAMAAATTQELGCCKFC